MKRRVISLLISMLMICICVLSVNGEEVDRSNSGVVEVNNTPAYFDDVVIEIPTEIANDSNARLAEIFLLRGGFESYRSGEFTWAFNLDCPTSLIDKPDVVVTVQLQKDSTDGTGEYENVGSPLVIPYNDNSDYSETHRFVRPAATGHYKFRYTIAFVGEVNPPIEYTKRITLNRTGHEWDYEFDDGRGKELPLPRADWVREKLHERDDTLPGRYYEEYEEINGIVLDRSKLRVHHIQPIFLGGDNDYDNLIHLPKDLHDDITGWYNGY